jgi:hypothetical protein
LRVTGLPGIRRRSTTLLHERKAGPLALFEAKGAAAPA